MSWVDGFVAAHGLDADAAAELRSLADGPLSGMLGSLLGDAPEPVEAPQPLRLEALLGRGAAGEVFRATDPKLDRQVAVKVLRADRQQDAEALVRFLREARVLASLQHPSIPPVYDVGTLPDGRPFVAMREVVGQSLRQVALAHHRGGATRSLQRRVRWVQQLAEAVGHAHAQGVVHRDIKPANVMIGADDALLLVDWGLAASVEGLAPAAVGTPSWIAPEVHEGQPHSPAADVFAVGRVLHGLLEHDAVDASAPVSDGLPSGLAEVLRRALAPDPAQRWPDGAALARALGEWLDGAERIRRALLWVDEAHALADAQRDASARLAEELAAAAAARREVHPFDPIETKRRVWGHEDRVQALRAQVVAHRRRRQRVLEDALGLAPELPEALEPLADLHRSLHDDARRQGDEGAADAHLQRVRRYDRGPHAAWLRGMARLSLHTDPAGAEVTLCTYEERDRQWVAIPQRVLGTTPLDVELPHGRYLLQLRAEGRAPVAYPVRLDRLQHWAGGLDEAPYVVYLPRADELSEGECYVPAGPFVHGADRAGFQSLPEQVGFLPGFVVGRHPVTHGDYLAFVNALVEAGSPDEALRWAPRAHGMEPSFYGRDDDGRFRLVRDADGDLWLPDWPVFFVDYASSAAYAAWRAAQTGQPWQLMQELQHEKAARGADGRIYPWGDVFDATFACVRDSHPGRPLPARVTDYPADCSVYGVRGLAGNSRTWCVERYAPPGGQVAATQRVVRGGCYFFPARGAHGAARMGLDDHRAGDTVGLRLVRPLDPFASP